MSRSQTSTDPLLALSCGRRTENTTFVCRQTENTTHGADRQRSRHTFRVENFENFDQTDRHHDTHIGQTSGHHDTHNGQDGGNCDTRTQTDGYDHTHSPWSDYCASTPLLDIEFKHMGILSHLKPSIQSIPSKYIDSVRQCYVRIMAALKVANNRHNLILWKKFCIVTHCIFVPKVDKKHDLHFCIKKILGDEWNFFTIDKFQSRTYTTSEPSNNTNSMESRKSKRIQRFMQKGEVARAFKVLTTTNNHITIDDLNIDKNK